MTNRDMVSAKAGADPVQRPNDPVHPAMPAPEDAAAPATRDDPIDSPQPNASAKRGAPPRGEHGLATKR